MEQTAMSYDTHDALAPVISPRDVQGQMTRLLDQFVQATPGATHAVLASTDGMRQAFCSPMQVDWVDELAAAFASLAGLARNVTGPKGKGKSEPVRQIMLERDDTIFLVTYAGTGSAFHQDLRTVATVLVVLVRPDANLGNVSYAVGRLVQKFADFMTTPVRERDGQDNGVE
ncbi:roadblock/LC7 domain-containing protein [Streptomyces sp. NPDC048484]|uniref:roadblock/LC7 domain-containing protein n=1 Tax=Streptomyces sp. NPDC048484 TaxID=3155146 RepID=UPI00344A8243